MTRNLTLGGGSDKHKAMIFVLPLFIVSGFVLVALWWFVFRAAIRHDSAIRAAKEREANFDRLLSTPNEPLYCLDCRKVFPGPLEESGCPHCAVRAFVIPARAHSDSSAGAAYPSVPKEASEVSPIRQAQRK